MGRQVGALLGRGEGAWAQTRTRRISRGLGGRSRELSFVGFPVSSRELGFVGVPVSRQESKAGIAGSAGSKTTPSTSDMPAAHPLAVTVFHSPRHGPLKISEQKFHCLCPPLLVACMHTREQIDFIIVD